MENFSWLLLDTNNDPIVGASPLPTILIRRVSDNAIFDWSDSAFKTTGWVTKEQNMAELDSVNFPGVYETSTDIASFDGLYYAYVAYTGTNKQQSVNEFNVTEGVVTNLLSGLSVTQETKLDAVPTTDNVADLTGVLDAIALIPTTDSIADLAPVLEALAAIPTTDNVADLTDVLAALAAIPTTPLLSADVRLDKIATIPADVWSHTQ